MKPVPTVTYARPGRASKRLRAGLFRRSGLTSCPPLPSGEGGLRRAARGCVPSVRGCLARYWRVPGGGVSGAVHGRRAAVGRAAARYGLARPLPRRGGASRPDALSPVPFPSRGSPPVPLSLRERGDYTAPSACLGGKARKAAELDSAAFWAWRTDHAETWQVSSIYARLVVPRNRARWCGGCRWRESNPQGQKPRDLPSRCVYRFRHTGTTGCEPR